MVSKSQIKLIRSLQQKKHRRAEKLFIAEGEKVISELLDSHFELSHLYLTEDLFSEVSSSKKTIITASDLEKISSLSTANNCLAVFKIPSDLPPTTTGLIVALDDVRDPGNLGTIIRLCDWFGIKQIVCSEETADVYNPKVVQASMGSIARVAIHYTDLTRFLKDASTEIFGTYMDGANIYNQKLPAEGIIVLGNEANGISNEVSMLIKNRISIPRFGDLQKTESLNVATATAIILSEFRRSSLPSEK